MNNFFSSAPAQPQGPSQLTAAKMEMDMYNDLFTKMGSMCFEKCTGRIKDADLTVGEMSCTDRCVSKYMESHERIGVVLKNVQEGMAAQQQAMAEMQAKYK